MKKVKNMKKQFKIIYRPAVSQYEVWFTNNSGEWAMQSIYYCFDRKGNLIMNQKSEKSLISESILWEINKLVDLGYKFVGIESSKYL